MKSFHSKMKRQDDKRKELLNKNTVVMTRKNQEKTLKNHDNMDISEMTT